MPRRAKGQKGNKKDKEPKKEKKGKEKKKVGSWDGDDYTMMDQDWPSYVLLKGQTYKGTGKRKAPIRDIRVNQVQLTVPGKILLKEETKFQVLAGNKYGVVGNNGLGKSVLMKTLSQREEPFQNVPEYINIIHVEQEISGDDHTALEAVVQSNQELAWLFQQEKLFSDAEDDDELDQSLMEKSYVQSTQSSRTYVQSTQSSRTYDLNDIHERMREVDAYKAEGKARKILSGLGFSYNEVTVKKSCEYSGGWRMRIALACALFGEPDLLILDEPTNHLDIPAVIWLESYLSKWKKSLLLVSHDRNFLDVVLDREDNGHIIHLHEQTLTYYKGNFQNFTTQLELKKREIENKKRKANKGKASKSKEKVEKPIVFNFPAPKDIKDINAVLSVKDVSFAYDSGSSIFKNLELGIYMDSRIGCVGPNGAGKSTLLKLIDKSLEPTQGFIDRRNCLRVARFHQHHVDQLNLDLSPLKYFISKYNGRALDIRCHLARFGVKGDLALQNMNSLSGGQKSRVAIADLAWCEPHVLLLDEPTNHLDMESIDALVEGISEFKGAVVIISHNQHLIEAATNKLWVVSKKGNVKIFNGTFNDYKDEIMARFDDQERISDCERSDEDPGVDIDYE